MIVRGFAKNRRKYQGFLLCYFLTICFFVSPISITLQCPITYLLAFVFVLLSDHWQARWQHV